MDTDVGAVLGQGRVADRLLEQLSEMDGAPVRLTGAAGSGKTRVAQQVAQRWREENGRVVVAVGDEEHARRPLYPLVLGLSRAHKDWAGLVSTGTRSAVRVADAVGPTGGVAMTVFDAMAAAFRHETERALKPYSGLERDIVLDLRRLARSRSVLLIADNAHWLDADTARLLADLGSADLRGAISQLQSVALLVVDTAEEQSTVAPEEFGTLVAKARARTTRIGRCSRDEFPVALRAFGFTGDLPDAVVSQLFSVTHGHLKLIEQIAGYAEQHTLDVTTISVADEYLATLIAQRLESLGRSNADVADLLVCAALFGLSCDEQDLRCVSDRHRAELRVLVERAVSIGFVERAADQISFSHEIIRSAMLGVRAAAQLEELYLKLADCLSRLRPGDYGARAQALLQGGDDDRAREMVALAAVGQIRRGVRAIDVRRDVALQVPDDDDLMAYLEVVASGYAAVASGNFDVASPRLRTSLPSETTLMAAERNYVAAICLLGRQTIEDATQAASLLASWAPALTDESELAIRFMVLLQQAQVLSECFDAARATETCIEQELSKRAPYDADAASMIQIQNRRAGALMAPEVAEDRIRAAVAFFRRGTGEPRRDRLELFRSLTNLSAIEIRLDQPAYAYAHAQEAERIAVDALDVGHRLDVLASNLVLSGHRSERMSLDETIERQALLAYSSDASTDNFLQLCNLSAYLLLASRDDAAGAELETLGERLNAEEIDETYLVYYWTALSVAHAALGGDTARALQFHHSIDDFIARLKWPTASYIRRRHALLSRALETFDPDTPRNQADRLLLDAHPPQIGAAWSYYGRLIPCVELSFWSDS